MMSKGASLIRDYVVLTVASFLFAICWECFMIPNGMSAGGFMGLCTIIQYATGGAVQAQYSYFVLNAILIIVGVFAMGLGFGFKTIFAIAMTSVAMQVLGWVPCLHCVEGQFLFIQERVLIPIVGGCFEALGIGLVLRYGGSTGGTDIVALMVHKRWNISLSSVFLISDLVVCSLLLFLPGKNFSDMCYGIEELVTFSLMIDMVVGGKRSSYQLLIFSEKYREIADYVTDVMERGVTLMDVQGWYTKKQRNVILVIVSQKEFPSLSQKIKEIDPRAFISVTPTHGVYGEGFEEIQSNKSK